jgi:hypothetical protein
MARLLTILAHREAGAWHDPYWIVPHWKSLGKQPFRNRDLSDLRTSRTYPKCFFLSNLETNNRSTSASGQSCPSQHVCANLVFWIYDSGPSTKPSKNSIGFLEGQIYRNPLFHDPNLGFPVHFPTKSVNKDTSLRKKKRATSGKKHHGQPTAGSAELSRSNCRTYPTHGGLKTATQHTAHWQNLFLGSIFIGDPHSRMVNISWKIL